MHVKHHHCHFLYHYDHKSVGFLIFKQLIHIVMCLVRKVDQSIILDFILVRESDEEPRFLHVWRVQNRESLIVLAEIEENGFFFAFLVQEVENHRYDLGILLLQVQISRFAPEFLCRAFFKEAEILHSHQQKEYLLYTLYQLLLCDILRNCIPQRQFHNLRLMHTQLKTF